MSIKSVEELLREASIQEVAEKQRPKTKLEQFVDWLATARPGSLYKYHVGSGFSSDRDALLLWKLKSEVWKLAVEGKVILLQRKVCENVYEYMLQKPKYPPLRARLVPDDYRQR